MLNQMGAGFVLKAYDSATPVIRRVGRSFGWLRRSVGKSMGGMNSAMSSTATGFMALHAGLGMVKLAKAAGDAASHFEQNLAAVGQISRATAKELLQLRSAAIEAALGTKFSPDEAVEGLKTLAAQGLRAEEAIQVLLPTLDLATGSMGQLGVAGAADAVVGSIKAMGFEMSEAGRVTNQLLKITQMTNFQTKDFSVAMGRTASTARLYGQSFEDSLITVGLIRNMNIEATVASTSLREAWRRLASDENAQQAVQKHGIKIFDDRTGKIRDMLGIMTELSLKTQKLNDKERMRLSTIAFGVRGMAAYNAVANATYAVMVNGEKVNLRGMNAINAMRFELSANGEVLNDNQEQLLKTALGVKELKEVLSTSTGVARQFRDALLDTYEGQKQLIGGAWQTLLVVIGEDFSKAMKPAAHALYELLSAITLFVKSMSPEAKQTVFKFVVALGALLALSGGMMLVSGLFSMMGGSILGFVFSIGKLVLIGVPLIMLLSGLGVGFGALFKAWKGFGKEGMDLETIMTKVRLAVSGMMSILTGEAFSGDLQKNLDKADNQGIAKFLVKFQRWVERLKTFWTGLKAGFEAGVASLTESSAFKRLQDKIQSIIAIFTGPDAENSPELLEEWKKKGIDAGVSLTRLGETAAGMIEKLIELGGTFANFVMSLDADDIKGTIDSFVEGFRTLGNVLNVISTALAAIYYTLKMVISGFIEFFGALGMGVEKGANTIFTKLFGTPEEMDKVNEYYKKTAGDAFSWTKGAKEDLTRVRNERLEYVREREADDAEFADREKRRLQISGLEDRKKSIENWTNLSAAEFHKDPKRAGQKAFSEAGPAMQQQYLNELSAITKQLDALTKKPVIVNMDGQKVAEIVGQQPSMTGEDSLDDAAGVGAL